MQHFPKESVGREKMAQLEQLLEEPLVAQQVAALAARVDDSHAGVSKEVCCYE